MQTAESKHTMQGFLLVLTGTALLFHTLGVFTTVISYILILLSLGLIVFGFIRGNFAPKIVSSIQQLTRKRR